MEPKYQQLWQHLHDRGFTSLGAEDWGAKYSQPVEYDKLYKTLTAEGADKTYQFSTSLNQQDFYKQYFGEGLKKKDESQVAPSVSVSDGTQTSSASPSVSGQDPTGSGTVTPIQALQSVTPQEVPYEEAQYLTGSLGDAINSIPIFGDIIDDSARAIAQGQRQGDVVNDAMRIMTKGAAATPEEVDMLLEEIAQMAELGPSTEFNNFQQIAQKEGGVFGFLKALATEPGAVPEVFLQSMSSMANRGSLAAAAPIVTIGAVGGGGAPGALASLPYAMAAAGTVLETSLSFVDQLQKEVEAKGLEFDRDAVMQVLQDDEALGRIRTNATVRGGTIGVIDALTGRVGSKVTARSLLRDASKVGTLAKTTVVEGTGGMLGEGAATVAVGEEPTVVDVGLEGLGATPGTAATYVAGRAIKGKAKYTVNGQPTDRKHVQELLQNATPEDLAALDIEVNNDSEFNSLVQERQAKAQISQNIPDKGFTDEQRQELIDLEYEHQQLKGKQETRSNKRRMQEIDTRINELFDERRTNVAQEAGLTEIDEAGLIVDGDRGTEVMRAEYQVPERQTVDVGRPVDIPVPTTEKAFDPKKQTHLERTRDYLIRKFQDRFIDVFRLQESVQDAQGPIAQDQDFRMAEELFYGKASDRIRLLEEGVAGITDKIRDAGLTMEQVDEYLYARHAKERNARLREERGVEDGSGMSDADADNIIASYEKDYGLIGPDQKASIQEIHSMVMDLAAENRKLLVESGLMSQEQIDALEAQYDYYVPLEGFAVDESGAGNRTSYPSGNQGFNVRGKEGKAAKGRESMAANPLAQLVTNSAALRIRAERNMALQKLHNLVKENPNDSVWKVVSSTNRPEAAVGVKIDGQEFFIEFEDASYAATLQEMGVEKISALARMTRGANNWLRRSFTTINPEFVLTNFTRDIQSAVVNAIAETELPDGQLNGTSASVTSLVKRVPQSMKALLSGAVGKDADPKMQQYYDEFRADGGKTGWAYAQSLADQKAAIEEAISGKNHKFGKKGFLDFVEGINDAMENSVRLAAYIEARESGVTREKAAQLAKNITVNFNKQGEWGPTLNSMYLFFNAAVQGSARVIRSMGSKKVQKGMAASVALAATLDMVNRGMSGEDEDGVAWYDKIPDYEKERNIIVMTGPGSEDYVKIPMPYGYSAFWNLGTAAGGVAGGARDVDDAVLFASTSALNSFSPISLGGGDDDYKNSVRSAAPSVTKPFLDIAINEGYFGNRVYNDHLPFKTRKAESALATRAPRAAREAAARLNEVMGGSKDVSSWIDTNIDKPWYILDFALGGAGKTAVRAAGTAKDVALGVDRDLRDMPFIRNFTGNAREGAFFYDMDKYLTNSMQIRQLFEEKKNKSKEDPESGRYDNVNFLYARYLGAEGKMKNIRRNLKEAEEIEDYAERTARVQELREKQRIIMMEWNKLYNERR